MFLNGGRFKQPPIFLMLHDNDLLWVILQIKLKMCTLVHGYNCIIEYEFEFHILRLFQLITAKRNFETTCDCVHKLQ